MIELHGASVTAPTSDGPVTILQPTSLTLTEPRISIIGANGSGKSTLARLFNGLITPASGTVTVSVPTPVPAQSPRNQPPGLTRQPHQLNQPTQTTQTVLDTTRHGAAVRRRVGFVFTNPTAQLVMPTVIEDVALSLRRTLRDKAERRRAAEAVLERFGLSDLADHSVHSLSGGQRQLLAIASVLATDPEIIVADEPTTLLDLRNSRLIGDLLMNLPQQVFLVTHDLDLAARCDRTIVVSDARIAFDGAPDAAIGWYRDHA